MTDLITTLEDEIVAQLQATTDSSYKVEAFPERPSEYRLYKSAIGGGGAVLVKYQGSRYTSNDNALNLRTMQWNITLLVRGIKDHRHANPLIQSVIGSLDGHQLSTGRKLRIQFDQFVNEESAVWIYQLMFHLDSPHVMGHQCLPNTTI